MEVYFEAMRFVGILLEFSKNKMYTGGFNRGLARTGFLVFMKSALPECIAPLTPAVIMIRGFVFHPLFCMLLINGSCLMCLCVRVCSGNQS